MVFQRPLARRQSAEPAASDRGTPTSPPPIDKLPSSASGHRIGAIRFGGDIGPPVIQRTKWRHDGTAWRWAGASSSDTDPHPRPDIRYPHAVAGDTYDQQTGAYSSPMRESLETVAASSGPLGFYDRRSTTAYGYFNLSGKKRQGPHTLSHIGKRVMLSAAVDAGRDPEELIGSRAAPRPRVANRKIRKALQARGKSWKEQTRSARTRYLKQYRKKWDQSRDQSKSVSKRLNALRSLMELNPATVYNIGSGQTSSSEIAGKGESRSVAARELSDLLSTTGELSASSVSGMSSIDLSGATPDETRSTLRMATSGRDWMRTGTAASDSDSSESDSEVELESEPETESESEPEPDEE